jgi:hypothetical protein
MNSTAPTYDNTQFWNDTAPAATVFTLGVNTQVNTDDDTYVAYCWHEVDGYSKFGGYTGNGSVDGTFVYTGFRPAWIMFKRTDSTSNWAIRDTARDEEFNVKEAYIALYWLILGKKSGPKVASIISEIERKDMLTLIESLL